MAVVRESPTIADLVILLMEQDLQQQTNDCTCYEALARGFLAATAEKEGEDDTE